MCLFSTLTFASHIKAVNTGKLGILYGMHAIPNLGGSYLFALSSISPFELSEFAISADIVFNLLWLCVL